MGLVVTMLISVNCANILANAAQKLVFSSMDYATTAEVIKPFDLEQAKKIFYRLLFWRLVEDGLKFPCTLNI